MKIRQFLGLSMLMATICLSACGEKSEKPNGNDNIHEVPGDDVNTPGDGDGDATIPETPNKPSIDEGVTIQGEINVFKAGGDFETAYAEWNKVQGATEYNVYFKKKDMAESAYQKIDKELVREYSNYVRADVVGIAEGMYDLKIEAVGSNTIASQVKDINVKKHDRAGFAFSSQSTYRTSSGAYNEDGTLKSNAKVLYITKETAKTVKLDVKIGSKDSNIQTCTGLQSILDARQKGYDTTPLAIRMVGLIEDTDMDHFSSTAEGLQIKGKAARSEMNITLEGVGGDATIKGFGILLRNCGNVEIRNIGIMLCMDDSISIDTDNTNIWVHNCDFFYGNTGGDSDQAKGDGAADTKDSQYITYSYNHFFDTGKTHLNGNATDSVDYITYHHNWYDHSDSRHPRVRCSTSIHVYNNYFDGVSKYGIGATMGSSVFAESNFFRNTNDVMMISGQGTDAQGAGTFSGENGGMIKAYGNTMTGNYKYINQKQSATSFDAYETESRTETIPSSVVTLKGGTSYSNFDTASTMYSYDVETASDSVVSVKSYAGRINGGNFKWEFKASEDRNYGVISELKQALINYNGTPVSGSSGTGSTTDSGTGSNTPILPSVPEDTTKWTTTVNANFAEMTIGTSATNDGLYYEITDNANPDASKATPTVGVTNQSLNNINVSSNKLNILDSSDDTTIGYYMFNKLEGKKTQISISLSGLKASGKWSFLTLIDENGNNIVIRTNDKKNICYSLDNGTTMLNAGNIIASNETISIMVDYEANKTTLYYGGKTVELNNVYNINGLKFTTAGNDSRSFVVEAVVFKTLA